MCNATTALTRKLIVIDIAPVNYSNNEHDSVFAGLLPQSSIGNSRHQQAKQLLANYIPQESVQQFMLKSFDAQAKEKFRFNLTALKNKITLRSWIGKKDFLTNQHCLSEADYQITFYRNTARKFLLNFHKQPLLQSMEAGNGYMLKKRIL